MRHLTAVAIAVAAVTSLAACVPAPIAPPAPHAAMQVSASFGRTWDAVIDEFAQRNIPIKTIDRASGLIATDKLDVAGITSTEADCGTDLGVGLRPTDATYNALVRGDSAHSTIRVTVRWVRVGPSRSFMNTATVAEECSSTGIWETAIERTAKERAEGKA